MAKKVGDKTEGPAFQMNIILFKNKMKLLYCDDLEVLPYDVDSE